MNARAAITRSAILGTQHGGVAIDASDPEAAALLVAQTDETPEHTILQAAAVLGTIRRAHVVPHAFEKREPPAPEELLPRCGALATLDLREILFADRSEFITEWLALAASFGLRCPEELLPKLLARGASDVRLRDAMGRAIGERGRWLARYDARWRYAIEVEDAVAVFAESSAIGDRVRALERLRAEDPPRARELLEASWPTEAPAERHRLLEPLAIGLSSADEPFLERVRSDKRKEVRIAANALVHALPQSLAAERAIVLAATYVTLKRGLLGRELAVTLPEFSPELAAEGIEEIDRKGAGGRSWMLGQLLEMVPIGYWLESFGMGLEKLFEIAEKNEFAGVLREGFARSIAAYRTVAARDEVLALAARDESYVDIAIAAAFDLPSSPLPETPFLEAFRNNESRAGEFVALASRPWSVELSSRALQAARNGLDRNVDAKVHFGRSVYFTLLAQNVHVATPEAIHGWPQSYANVNAELLATNLLDKLTFRRAMYDHLKDGS